MAFVCWNYVHRWIVLPSCRFQCLVFYLRSYAEYYSILILRGLNYYAYGKFRMSTYLNLDSCLTPKAQAPLLRHGPGLNCRRTHSSALSSARYLLVGTGPWTPEHECLASSTFCSSPCPTQREVLGHLDLPAWSIVGCQIWHRSCVCHPSQTPFCWPII